ncbi:MAG TPA: hypothetical protein VKB88_34195 [Bryobacteraceae bacterium]|nr:hypothetical protein [Bryobacteraceae bacterium]
MKALSIFAAGLMTYVLCGVARGQSLDEIRKMEDSGNTAEARAALAKGVQSGARNTAMLTEYAEFLERYGDAAAREQYGKLLTATQQAGDSTRAAEMARRLVVLDLLAGDTEAASSHADTYKTLTGKILSVAPPAGVATVEVQGAGATIPGPMRSFARMAAISPDAKPEDILPALARNVVTNGYEASHSNEALEQTEYLKLVHRYLSQARELDKLAGEQHVINVPSCDAPNVAELLRILGFRMRGGCGAEVVLETVNAARAFLTTDSGFPVNKLEEALRTNRPFTYDFHPARVPVLFGPDYWMAGAKESPGFVETLIGDPSACRLYLGLSKLDNETAEALRKGSTYVHLKAFAHVLDFFGGMFEIRNGKAVVPGGAHAAASWGELVGVSPDKGAEFFDKLITRDDGWMASLYDALARINTPVRDYLTEPARMKRFYTAVRGRITSPGPARPVFRSNTDMMLLTTRLQLDANGKPHIPGNLEIWKALFTSNPQAKYDGKLTRLATTWKEPDDLLEALFALCRKSVENEPLKIFMALTDVDRGRPTPLEPTTVDRLARAYRAYGSQYEVFSESRQLSDKSINEYLDQIEGISKIRDPLFRSDVAGSLQSLVGLWQILVRQQTIRDDKADAVFAGVVGGFAQVRSDRELFQAGRNGVKLLLGVSNSSNAADAATQPQERLVDLMAGAADSEDAETRQAMEEEIVRILDSQHIVSLDTLFQIADMLEKWDKSNTATLGKLSARITEVPIPRPPLSANERNALGFGYWTERHLDAERKLNIRLAVEKAAGDPTKIKDAEAQLAPVLRDTLVAFNYAHYAPPGAQILYTNPVFVRSHDFIGGEGQSHMWKPTEPYGTGWPSNGGGRLVGSLASLPYALAEAEQNFLVPTQTQALIWGDLVPQMILSAKIPRWWNVTPVELHYVALHLRYGRELVAQAAADPEMRGQVLGELARLAAPVRTEQVRWLIERGRVKDAVDLVTPSELFALARDLAPRRTDDSSCLRAEIKRLSETQPKQANYMAVSRAFGTPKPTLANSYQPELLNLRTFPTLMGYSSRIMAESWESNTLYWAALADELSLRPAQLNLRIPDWTRQLVEHIFASHLEDWPALLKSLRQVGDNVRAQARAGAVEQKAALQEDPTGK